MYVVNGNSQRMAGTCIFMYVSIFKPTIPLGTKYLFTYLIYLYV